MKFEHTGQVDTSVYAAYLDIMTSISTILSAVFSTPPLSEVDVMVSYCPIILPDNISKHFPAKPNLTRDRTTYYCHTEVDFSEFSRSNKRRRVEMLLDGLSSVTTVLRDDLKLPEYSKSFSKIMESIKHEVIDL